MQAVFTIKYHAFGFLSIEDKQYAGNKKATHFWAALVYISVIALMVQLNCSPIAFPVPV